MILDLFRDLVAAALIIGGGFFVILGALGINRMPDVFTRLHAVSLSDTIGASLILLGLAVESGWNLVTARLVILVLFLLFAGPMATHAVIRAALHAKLKPLGADESAEPGSAVEKGAS
ncbi:MAG: monovalent cation/H(+) antiporter subunit G [Bauldia sp.]|nr:monovalent cation/H(+) antiporter subunit G [Bauldia sp.]